MACEARDQAVHPRFYVRIVYENKVVTQWGRGTSLLRHPGDIQAHMATGEERPGPLFLTQSRLKVFEKPVLKYSKDILKTEINVTLMDSTP